MLSISAAIVSSTLKNTSNMLFLQICEDYEGTELPSAHRTDCEMENIGALLL
jgi:hypothetical protein